MSLSGASRFLLWSGFVVAQLTMIILLFFIASNLRVQDDVMLEFSYWLAFAAFLLLVAGLLAYLASRVPPRSGMRASE